MIRKILPVQLCRTSLLGLSLCFGHAMAAPGDLDLTFGQDGVMLVNLNGGQEHFSALLAQPDGSVLAAGALYHRDPVEAVQSGYDMSIVRVLRDGQLDPGFGVDGLVQVDTGDDSDAGYGLAQQADGKLLVAGRLDSGAYGDFGVARLNPDGTLDTSFGEIDGPQRRGYRRINIGPTAFINDEARAVALQSDGRIVVAGVGYAMDGSFNYPRFAVARFTTSGDLDTSFGSGGTMVAPATAAEVSEYVTGIATRRDGSMPNDRITVVGYVFARSTAVVRRYLSNGQPDTSFGSGGELQITESMVNGQRQGMTRIDAGVWTDAGKLVVVGTGGDRGFVFQRFNANGSLDTTFGSGGRVLVKFSGVTEYDEPVSITLLDDGRIVAAGYASMTYGSAAASKDFAVVQLLPDGTPDPAFGDGHGRSTYPLSMAADQAFAIAATADGDLLAAGTANDDEYTGPGDSRRGAFMRLQGDRRLFRDSFE